MAITYSKVITGMQAYVEIDGQSNVVFNIMWDFVGSENGLTASCPTSTAVEYVAGEPFTPYDQLTQEQVIGWVDQFTPPDMMQQYQDMVTQSLATQQNKEMPPLPWSQ